MDNVDAKAIAASFKRAVDTWNEVRISQEQKPGPKAMAAPVDRRKEARK